MKSAGRRVHPSVAPPNRKRRRTTRPTFLFPLLYSRPIVYRRVRVKGMRRIAGKVTLDAKFVSAAIPFSVIGVSAVRSIALKKLDRNG